ncbi:MAG: hypothetical protein WKG01_25805 [Kofleriaceae bacterium]
MRLQPGMQLGDYVIGEALWPLRIADAYRANGPLGPATVYVVHAAVAANPQVRDQVIAGTRAAAALPEHKHLVRTLAAGLTGEILWIATEEVDGSLVRELLAKKRRAQPSSSSASMSGGPGLGTRAAGNLIAGVAAALAETSHGALDAESVVVSRTGRVRVIDLALGAGTLAAMLAGLIPQQSSIAPELLAGTPPNPAGDVYAVGALLYESLVGSPLERGGPRPSDVVQGVNTQIDEVVARACHREASKRFGRVDVLGEVVTESLSKGGAMMTALVPLLDKRDTLDQQVSLAAQINDGPSVSGNPVIDRALAAALADSTEKWLVSKGKLDYGPFSLADVVTQIEKGDIVAGNIIMDKDTGARVDVGEHPLLGPMVETARQQRDAARRAQAEVVVQSRDKTRGVMLYAFIGAGVIGVVVAVYFIIAAVRKDETTKVAGINALEGASLKVNVSMPKKPPPIKRAGGKRPGGSTRPGGNQGTEDLSLDMSDESDEGGETLDMGRVYGTYSRYGGQLGGCLQRTGEGQANIYINIDGPSGKVKFVKINGKTAGPLFSCMSGVLRGMKFPSINGPRTRAEFDISM